MDPTNKEAVAASEGTPSLISKPVRYCFRVHVQHIPGPPLARSLTLANDFMRPRFDRDFDWAKDYVHTPVNIGEQGKSWVLLDVDKNVHKSASSQDVDLVILRVKQDENGILKYTNVNYFNVRSFTSTFPWGGRSRMSDKSGQGKSDASSLLVEPQT
ncbi:hypothetical protein MCOR25_004853 [Pyricularia grisea]|nr:hypothetical protein MCOR25_004853 [Pyricularia grisea]